MCLDYDEPVDPDNKVHPLRLLSNPIHDETKQRRDQSYDNDCGGCFDGGSADPLSDIYPLQVFLNAQHRNADPVAGAVARA